jgi:hypothetical protein
MLPGRPWIERDHARRKEEEEVLNQKKQELKDFITKRIAHLIEEYENRSQLFNNNDVDIKVARTLEDPQKTEIPNLDKEEGLPLNLRKTSQQREVTMPKEDNNQNKKRHTKTKLTGKKARKLSKKRAKFDIVNIALFLSISLLCLSYSLNPRLLTLSVYVGQVEHCRASC